MVANMAFAAAMPRDLSYNTDCSDDLNVQGKAFDSGIYKKISGLHNGRTVYQHVGNKFCIFYGGHWKIENCDWLTRGDDSSLGWGWSSVNAMCPGDIGPMW